jgi:hypothetical protein
MIPCFPPPRSDRTQSSNSLQWDCLARIGPPRMPCKSSSSNYSKAPACTALPAPTGDFILINDPAIIDGSYKVSAVKSFANG